MLNIIQSNKVDKLFDHLLKAYKDPALQGSIFEPFQVIVPSKVMGEWLKKQVADKAGISTLVTTEFWGRYFLGLMQRVLRTYARISEDKDVLEVPEVAMLSKNVMQWQIFGFLLKYQDEIIHNEGHPLYPFLYPLFDNQQKSNPILSARPISEKPLNLSWANNQSLLSNDIISQSAELQSIDQRLWQLASDMASMLNRYMTYRPQWLVDWGQDKPIAIEEMITKKDALHNRINGRTDANAVTTPDWLVEHYEQLEKAQRFLWLQLFDDDYQFREALHEQFWQALTHHDSKIANICRSKLPKHVFLFTLQQLPPTELLDLQRLGKLTDVTILHFNPSEQFWADIVDKTWLMQQQLDNTSAMYLKDYGHTLLSRFGKQSREVFAMLASLSGNQYQDVMWQDDFDTTPPNSLLQFLQHDILMLDEVNTSQKITDMIKILTDKKSSQETVELSNQSLTDTKKLLQQQLANIQSNGLTDLQSTTNLLKQIKQESQKLQTDSPSKWQPKPIDTSIAIHVCHSIVRQLEVLRMQIIGWLNYTDKQSSSELIPTNPWERRALSDILVLVPDIEAHQNIIEAVFPKHVGTDGYQLPAKVTGVVAKDINQLWQAITGYYNLLNRAGARFNRTEVFDWLMLAPLYESFGLNLEQMTRACELLEQAGFIRGFDENHLEQTLNDADDDYRYTFAYALERLVAGVIMPNASAVNFGEYTNSYGVVERFLPLNNLTMADADIVAVLCDIYQTLDENRYVSQKFQTLNNWLKQIEALIQDKFVIFNQTNAWRAIFAAMNDLLDNIEANKKQIEKLQNLPSHKKPINQSGEQIDTENLPLKLNFVLENIAQSIINQQVSAEPSGVITFARIGTVRNLPYELVVMLNLNLSEFPNQEQQNRYNLMQAGLPIRGDRFREDDDLGAFLDALLCAKQACWIFYNGKSTVDTHEHLPASPVQELLEFLQMRIDISDEEFGLITNNSLSKNNQNTNFEQIVKDYLVTQHAALPFDKSYFELEQHSVGLNEKLSIQSEKSFAHQLKLAKTALYPPAKIWHNLYTALQDKDQTSSQPIIEVWDKSKLTKWLREWQKLKPQIANLSETPTQHYVALSKIANSFKDPAKAFVREQNIYVHTFDDSEDEFEPLTLNGLTNYQLNNALLETVFDQPRHDNQIDNESIDIAIGELLPAGVNRYHTRNRNAQQLEQDIVSFINQVSAIDERLKTNGSTLLGQFFADNFADIDITNSKSSIEAVANALTPCEEQRLAIKTLSIDTHANITKHKQTWVITANVPVFNDHSKVNDDSHADWEQHNPSYWFNYLPTNGKEKYLLQFWLHHLCWQVVRRTTINQAHANDGFSLWQFSNKKTVYLPAMSCEQAYGYLQDVMMVYQLIGKVVTILPPTICLEFINGRINNPEENVIKHLGKWRNKVDQFNFADVDSFYYPFWQQLIGDYKPSVIIPFLETLGELIYLPINSFVKDVNQLVEEQQ